MVLCPEEGTTRLHKKSNQDPFVAQLQSNIRDSDGQKFAPFGARSKPALVPRASACGANVVPLDIRDYRGIVAYDPSEFLITARAGTPIADLQALLARHGQYLPFDPLFVADSATLGGTIASGISGPDRLLYGGIRDFIMEIAMLDGLGSFVRGGGKVVKNAAGFDTPKLMVGSYGRLGVILEATLKVFPVPQGWATVIFDNSSLDLAVSRSQQILSRPLPIAGMDINTECQLVIRLAAPASSLRAVAERIENLVGLKSRILIDGEHSQYRKERIDWLESAPKEGESLIRVAMTPNHVLRLYGLLNAFHIRSYLFCSAGCTAWIRMPDLELERFSMELGQLALSGIVVRSQANALALGDLSWQQMATRIQHAADPNGRFMGW
mgnify:CR=1 FL=1